MPTSPVFHDLVSREISLFKIFLDPNNPRFVSSDWQIVPDSDITQEAVQEEARARLIRNYSVDKLKMSMEVNGYLPIDRVIVRRLPGELGDFVVLEGNRRVCAAKLIGKVDSEGKAIDEEVINSLQEIPCLEYIGQQSDAAWIFQGLRHISGIVEWSAYNKAKLLVEQMESEGLNLTDAGRRFGLSAFGAGQWVRGFYAFKQAKEDSDFIAEVDERSYPYFQELFSRSSLKIREWLDWNETEYKFIDELKFDEFVSWLYPRPDGEIPDTSKGDFEKRRLLRRDDIRTLASLLEDDPASFQQFRTGQALSDVVAMASAKAIQLKAEANADRVEAVFAVMGACMKALEEIPHKIFKNADLKLRFDGEKDALMKCLTEL
jgi:hypothetical protein